MSKCIYSQEQYDKINNELNKANYQVAELKAENEKLEEQLKNAIVPKFKAGDKVYGIIDTFTYTVVLPVEIRDTHLLYEVWDGEYTTKQHSTRIFATEEEAIKKLQELKGKVEKMLKIKDNVDLKELEKFGFVYNNFGFYAIRKNLPYGRQSLYVDEDRTISIVGDGEELLVNLYDLIQAGLVDKMA